VQRFVVVVVMTAALDVVVSFTNFAVATRLLLLALAFGFRRFRRLGALFVILCLDAFVLGSLGRRVAVRLGFPTARFVATNRLLALRVDGRRWRCGRGFDAFVLLLLRSTLTVGDS